MPREPRAKRRRRSGKVSRNQIREALQTKCFISEPEISAEPEDFSEGKGRCCPPQKKKIKNLDLRRLSGIGGLCNS